MLVIDDNKSYFIWKKFCHPGHNKKFPSIDKTAQICIWLCIINNRVIFVKHWCTRGAKHIDEIKSRLFCLQCVTGQTNRPLLLALEIKAFIKFSFINSSQTQKAKQKVGKSLHPHQPIKKSIWGAIYPVRLCQKRLWKNRKQNRNTQAQLPIAHLGTSYLKNCHSE